MSRTASNIYNNCKQLRKKLSKAEIDENFSFYQVHKVHSVDKICEQKLNLLSIIIIIISDLKI